MRPKKPERWASSTARSAAMFGPSEELAAVTVASLRRTKYWLSVGVHVNARNSEVKRETVMVTASARKKEPVTPVVEINGRNTTTGVTVEPIKGMVNSFKALRIA